MRRTLIQFDEVTYRQLRERAFRQERSVSSLVREIVARELQSAGSRNKLGHISQFASVAAGRSKQGPLAPVSERHDEALAEAFRK